MKAFLFIGGLAIFAAVTVGRCAVGAPNPATLATTTPTATIADQRPAVVATPTLQPIGGEPVRVRFNRGSYGATLAGSTSTKYLLWAAQGQTFTTTLTSNSTAIVSLSGPDGKPLFEQLAAGYTAASKLPANGDYALEVRTSGAYTVGVEIR